MSLTSQLIRDEGVRRTAYLDSRGNCTFGVGHKGSTPLTQAAINRILGDDIASHASDVMAALPWTTALSPNRFNVLVNICFNLGIGGLLEFNAMLTALQNDDYAAAAEAMQHSKWADQVGERAERLAKQILTDQEQ